MNKQKNISDSIFESRFFWYVNQKYKFDIIEEDSNEEDKDEIIFCNNFISYNVSMPVCDHYKLVLFKKSIIIDKSNHYLKGLDKFYNEVISILKILNIN